MKVEERLLKYVKIDTQSDPKSDTIPSTMRQKDLARVLVEEMKEIGIEDAYMDDYGYVYGTIPGNVEGVETVGFIAHMDTSPEITGANVKPRIIENYDGKDIYLNEEVVAKVSVYPFLEDYIGKSLMVTDGNTLLGADDKAGIAEIMTMAEYFHTHPEVEHGTIRIGFTPDEEVGRGADKFNVEAFNADFAYTVDGSEPNCVAYENFNAAAVTVTVKGISFHPGDSKNKMVNAINLAMKFHGLLPEHMRPEYTEGYDGFNHLMKINGAIELVELEYIIRNHDEELFEKQKKMFENAAEYLNKEYKDAVTLEMKDSYRNMKEGLKDKMFIVDLAKEAISEVGLTPESEAIRGGTDGVALTYMGLPCPNLGTGGFNFHGRYEMCCIEDMRHCVDILIKIAEKVAQRKAG
jgi:peptidase T